MTTKEEIIALANKLNFPALNEWGKDLIEAFYHAARKPLEEQYASMTKSFFDAQAQLREALALESKWRVEATGLRQQLAAAKFARRQAETDKSDVERTLVAAKAEIERLKAQVQSQALEAVITKAGEVMRERSECVFSDPSGKTIYKWDEAVEAIRALPGVTLADLKGAE